MADVDDIGNCPELEDIGGAEPLQFENERAMLRAAALALHSLAMSETGERRSRLLLLGGYLYGMSARD